MDSRGGVQIVPPVEMDGKERKIRKVFAANENDAKMLDTKKD